MRIMLRITKVDEDYVKDYQVDEDYVKDYQGG